MLCMSFHPFASGTRTTRRSPSTSVSRICRGPSPPWYANRRAHREGSPLGRHPGTVTRSRAGRSDLPSLILWAIFFRVPIASMVTIHPSISLDWSSTFTCAKSSRFLFAQALTMWIAGLSMLLSKLLRAVLPSIALSSAPPSVWRGCPHPRQNEESCSATTGASAA